MSTGILRIQLKDVDPKTFARFEEEFFRWLPIQRPLPIVCRAAFMDKACMMGILEDIFSDRIAKEEELNGVIDFLESVCSPSGYRELVLFLPKLCVVLMNVMPHAEGSYNTSNDNWYSGVKLRLAKIIIGSWVLDSSTPDNRNLFRTIISYYGAGDIVPASIMQDEGGSITLYHSQMEERIAKRDEWRSEEWKRRLTALIADRVMAQRPTVEKLKPWLLGQGIPKMLDEKLTILWAKVGGVQLREKAMLAMDTLAPMLEDPDIPSEEYSPILERATRIARKYRKKVHV
ncbi:MAG: hypothetical protein Q7R79_00235, partial [bacterium]|nr:hypothetical protein [bacterium]